MLWIKGENIYCTLGAKKSKKEEHEEFRWIIAELINKCEDCAVCKIQGLITTSFKKHTLEPSVQNSCSEKDGPYDKKMPCTLNVFSVFTCLCFCSMQHNATVKVATWCVSCHGNIYGCNLQITWVFLAPCVCTHWRRLRSKIFISSRSSVFSVSSSDIRALRRVTLDVHRPSFLFNSSCSSASCGQMCNPNSKSLVSYY